MCFIYYFHLKIPMAVTFMNVILNVLITIVYMFCMLVILKNVQ